MLFRTCRARRRTADAARVQRLTAPIAFSREPQPWIDAPPLHADPHRVPSWSSQATSARTRESRGALGTVVVTRSALRATAAGMCVSDLAGVFDRPVASIR